VKSAGRRATLGGSMRPSLAALLAAITLAAGCRNEPPPAPPTSVPSPTAPAATGPKPAGSDAITTGHPRIWITESDLPRLRKLVSPENPMWAKGLKVAVDQAIATYDKEFFPGGQPNAKWPDPGIDNWVGKCTEAYAEIFAFMSLVDPDPAARAQHAERAKKLLMHVIEEAAKGMDTDRRNPAPFRGPAFATYNRANYWGEAFGLTVDWIYPSLSADEKAAIRKVFMRWASENVNAATAGNEHPEPTGVINDPRLLANKKHLRWATNNYFTGHMRQLALMGLALDEGDDPPVDAAAPRGKLGNTLRSYLDDAVGAWLYQQYAVYEEPQVVAAAYGVPAEGLGVASGGLSPEGFLYGHSIGVLHQALLGLYTAGYRDPGKLGPQIKLIESKYWDRYLEGYLQSITPVPERLGYHGESYPIFNYGDTLRAWITPDHALGFATMALYDMRTGNAARLEKARWIMAHVVEGGAARTFDRAARIWGNSEASAAVLLFLSFDPEAKAPADPRPQLGRVFHDKAIGRIIARTEWSPNATVFAHKCSWSTVGHQFGDCGMFELYRKGEWLTKERSGYASDRQVMAPENHNVLAIRNTADGGDKPRGMQWFEDVVWEKGGQFGLGLDVGDPSVIQSLGATWVYAHDDATNLYNRVGATDVKHASRSIAWIMPDRVVVYDRAETKADGKFKRFHLTFVGEPTVDGKRTTVKTARGQQLFVHTLLPAAAAITTGRTEKFNQVAEGEPTQFRLVVEDPKSPREIRFLHALEGADAGATPAAVTMVQSRGGTPYVGAVIGTTAVLFAVDATARPEKVTYAVPAAVTGQLVTGLVPGGGYDVTVKPAGGSIEVTIVPGSGRRANDGGVIAIGALEAK
jgi:hypothetical protein